jgi:adenylosuccinate lyase
MAGVRAGGDRQVLHEQIRRHALAAAEQVKQHGRANDLIERLRRDSAFAGITLDDVLDPHRFVGRAPQQVDRFLAEVVEPIRARYRDALTQPADLKV